MYVVTLKTFLWVVQEYDNPNHPDDTALVQILQAFLSNQQKLEKLKRDAFFVKKLGKAQASLKTFSLVVENRDLRIFIVSPLD